MAKPISKSGTKKPKVAAKAKPKAKPKLLAGGNPQIAKGDGEAPVREYIAATPGWKKEVVRKVDEIISSALPRVRKAVKWNSPFYGCADESHGWFLNVHVFTRYVKLTFFRGDLLNPVPKDFGKYKEVRHFNIFEDDEIDEKLIKNWVKQAVKNPGWRP